MASLNKRAHRQVLLTSAALLIREGGGGGGQEWVRTVIFVGCTCIFLIIFALVQCLFDTAKSGEVLF